MKQFVAIFLTACVFLLTFQTQWTWGDSIQTKGNASPVISHSNVHDINIDNSTRIIRKSIPTKVLTEIARSLKIIKLENKLSATELRNLVAIALNSMVLHNDVHHLSNQMNNISNIEKNNQHIMAVLADPLDITDATYLVRYDCNQDKYLQLYTSRVYNDATTLIAEKNLNGNGYVIIPNSTLSTVPRFVKIYGPCLLFPRIDERVEVGSPSTAIDILTRDPGKQRDDTADSGLAAQFISIDAAYKSNNDNIIGTYLVSIGYEMVIDFTDNTRPIIHLSVYDQPLTGLAHEPVAGVQELYGRFILANAPPSSMNAGVGRFDYLSLKLKRHNMPWFIGGGNQLLLSHDSIFNNWYMQIKKSNMPNPF